ELLERLAGLDRDAHEEAEVGAVRVPARDHERVRSDGGPGGQVVPRGERARRVGDGRAEPLRLREEPDVDRRRRPQAAAGHGHGPAFGHARQAALRDRQAGAVAGEHAHEEGRVADGQRQGAVLVVGHDRGGLPADGGGRVARLDVVVHAGSGDDGKVTASSLVESATLTALTVATPTPTAVTLPSSSTVATFVLELAHATSSTTVPV